MDEEVPSRAETVDDPVEVALALPVALVIRQARVAAMLVANGGQPSSRTVTRRVPSLRRAGPGSTRCRGSDRAEPLVERATRGVVGTPEGQQVALDGVDLPAGASSNLRRSPDVIPIRPRRHRWIVQSLDQRRDDVAGGSTLVSRAPRPAPSLGASRHSRPRHDRAARLSRRSRSADPDDRPPALIRPPALPASRGPRSAPGTAVGDDHDGRRPATWLQGVDRALQVDAPIGGEHDDRREPVDARRADGTLRLDP